MLRVSVFVNSFIGLTSSYLHARNYLWERVQSFCQYSLAFEELLKALGFYGCIKVRNTVLVLDALQKHYHFVRIPGFVLSPYSPKRKEEKPTECPKTC